MPRKSGGRNNPSHKRARKRTREQLTLAMREARFHAMAKQNGLFFESHGKVGGFRARLDMYEWAVRHARKVKAELPRELLMGSAMGWLLEHIEGYEAGENKRETKRQKAEENHADKLFEAAAKRLNQWIPQPVPDDFECPYTGVVADKRKILATGVRYERIEGASPSKKDSYLYSGHETLVVYRTGHRGKWYVAREIWDGTSDSDGNRVGVKIESVSFGDVEVTRSHSGKSPGLPYRGVKGHSGQAGRPILREQSGTAPSPIEGTFTTRVGYDTEVDARKQAQLNVYSVFVSEDVKGKRKLTKPAAVMGKEHVDLRRASRMRGGARTLTELRASAPYSNKPGERHTITIPAHLWCGDIVEDNAPRTVKRRRGYKEPELVAKETPLSPGAMERLDGLNNQRDSAEA